MLLKEKRDYLFGFFLFALIIFIVAAVLFISYSIKRDLMVALENEGQIIVMNNSGGRYMPLSDEHIDAILEMNGVDNVVGVLDGYYLFLQDDKQFHIVVDDTLDDQEMSLSQDIANILKKYKYEKEFHFLIKDHIVSLAITKILESNIISHNTILVNNYIARQILNVDEGEYSYLHVIVPNEAEVENISLKIPRIYPNLITVPDYKRRSDANHLYYYKGGIFMILYIVSFVSFFILLKNQVSSVYGNRSKEIAILRSMGFSIGDIIFFKFIQNGIVSVGAYFVAICMAYMYVFVFGAPFLKDIFLGDDVGDIIFTPVVDVKMLVLVFIFSVIPYMASILIPSWRLAIEDIDGVMK